MGEWERKEKKESKRNYGRKNREDMRRIEKEKRIKTGEKEMNLSRQTKGGR